MAVRLGRAGDGPEGPGFPVLRLVALCGPEGVPENVLLGDRALKVLGEFKKGIAAWPGEVTRKDVRATLKALHQLSLVDESEGPARHRRPPRPRGPHPRAGPTPYVKAGGRGHVPVWVWAAHRLGTWGYLLRRRVVAR